MKNAICALVFSLTSACALAADSFGSARVEDAGTYHNFDLNGIGYYSLGNYGSVSYNLNPLPSIYIDARSPVPPPENNQSSAVTEIDTVLNYSFRVNGPDPTALVPINIFGRYELQANGNTNPKINVANWVSARLSVYGSSDTFYIAPLNCISTWEGKSGCGAVDFHGAVTAWSGTDISVHLEAHASDRAANFSSYGDGTTTTSSSAYIDPYFVIDPVWANAHPGYSLVMEAGVGNALPVPEPSIASMAALGLVGLALHWRRRRCNGLNT